MQLFDGWRFLAGLGIFLFGIYPPVRGCIQREVW